MKTPLTPAEREKIRDFVDGFYAKHGKAMSALANEEELDDEETRKQVRRDTLAKLAAKAKPGGCC